jgi:hypothetical protein
MLGFAKRNVGASEGRRNEWLSSPLNDAQIAEEEKIAERSLLKQESLESVILRQTKKGKKKRRDRQATGWCGQRKKAKAAQPRLRQQPRATSE